MSNPEFQAMFQQLAQNIRSDNEALSKATPDEQRVIVAKDVLKLLEAGAINPTFADAYLTLPSEVLEIGVNQYTEIASVIPKLPPCQVCGVGAAMLSTLLIKDEVTFMNQGLLQNPRIKYVRQHFSSAARPSTTDPVSLMTRRIFPSQLLRAIEAVYEDGDYGYDIEETPQKRLRAIYQNIIANKGMRFTSWGNNYQIWPTHNQEPEDNHEV